MIDISYFFESSIYKALDLLKEWAAIIWAEDYPYIIAFILFILICAVLNSAIKKKHYH